MKGYLHMSETVTVPQKKHKILMLSDHPLCTSGVGVQARFLIQGLLNTGKYTFRCLGGAIKHPNYDPIKLLNSGDDYELIFTSNKKNLKKRPAEQFIPQHNSPILQKNHLNQSTAHSQKFS